MSNMVVQTNMLALNAHRNMGITGNSQARSSARLSSGFRINSAADDAAGLAISERMRGQIRSIDQASRNAQDGISLIQVAEGALGTINDMLNRMRELTVQASNDTYTEGDREQLQREVRLLIEEIYATSNRVEFNTLTLLNGDLDSLHLQIGPNAHNGTFVADNNVSFTHFADILTRVHEVLDDTSEVDLVTGNGQGYGLTGHIDTIDATITEVNNARAAMGAWMNRLEYTVVNLDVASENLSAANSRIRDADMAREMMRFTQTNVLQQAAISMLAQANMAPQNILQLLR